MSVTLFSTLTLLGWDVRAYGKIERVGLAVITAWALSVLNRRLIRRFVVDRDGQPRPELGNTTGSRVAGLSLLVGLLILVIVAVVTT